MRIIIAAGIILISSFAFAADIPDFQEFSADVVTADGRAVSRGKTYVARDKHRMEIPGAVIITRLDQDKSWVFIPEERIYLEQPIDRKFVSSASEKMANETGREPLGTEMVDGKSARKYRVSYLDGTGPAVILQWIDEDTGIPVRTAAVDGSWSVEYRNIKVGPVDPELFEIPKGYVPVAMPVPPPGIPDDMGREDG